MLNSLYTPPALMLADARGGKFPFILGQFMVFRREAIAAMRLALASEGPDANERFAVSAMGYVVLLHEHIQKEDHILYPMADSVFDEAVEERLAQAFAKLEAQPGEAEALARNLEIAERLAERFGVERGAAREPFKGCCHQHGSEAGGSCH